MANSAMDGDFIFRSGLVTFAGTVQLPSGSISEAALTAGTKIPYTKAEHRYYPFYAQPVGVNVVAEHKAVHVAIAAGTIRNVKAGIVTIPSGDRTAIVNVKKNGTTVLSANIVLDSANVAWVSESGSISTTAFVAGDVLSVDVTLGAGVTGTNPQGLFCEVDVTEDP